MIEEGYLDETVWKQEVEKSIGSKPRRVFWKPVSINDGCSGTFLGMRSGRFGMQPELKGDGKYEGQILSIPRVTMVMSELKRQDVKAGDHVILLYQGTRPSQKSNPMQIYEVTVTKP